MLVAAAGCAAVVVLAWSLLAALSVADATPYWLGSLGVIFALAAAFLIFKDLVLWPFRFLGPRLSELGEAIRRWLSSFAAGEPSTSRTTPRQPAAPPARRRH